MTSDRWDSSGRLCASQLSPTRTGTGVAGRREKKSRVTHPRSEAGVRRCVELITGGEWQTGKSHALVAEEFGVSPRTAETWAAAAAKVVRMALGDGEDIKTRLAVMLETIQQKALGRQSATMAGEMYDNPDLKSAVVAIKTEAELLGLVTQNHKVDLSVQAYEQLEPAAMRAKLLEQRARIDEALSKLEADTPLALPANGPEGAPRIGDVDGASVFDVSSFNGEKA